MQETIELKELLDMIFKRKLLIILVLILCTAMGSLYSIYFLKPIYKSSTTLMVNSAKGLDTSSIAASFDLGSINVSQKLVVTYGEIVKSRIVLEQVIDKLNLDISYNDLIKKINSTPVNNTEILKIEVKDEDPIKAAVIANTISDVFIKEVMRILKVDNVETIDKAITQTKPINVNISLNIIVSAVLGLIAGIFLSLLLEYLDRTIKTSEDVQRHLGLQVIGSIPDYSKLK